MIEARKYLGKASEHTVYEAEAMGLAMAMGMLSNERGLTSVTIAIDSQATVKAAQTRSGRPGGYILDIAHDLHREARKHNPNLSVTIRWVPSHVGIEGNEVVDGAAKKAARGHSTPEIFVPRDLLNLPASVSSLKHERRAELRKQAPPYSLGPRERSSFATSIPQCLRRTTRA